jgi:2,3-bisphosphoglycerate-dependent phosphoglycerate mutase
MTILVVRHGETDGNAARILQRPDVPLNDRGIRQAEQLAARLCGDGFVHILCSDLLRARMTAAPIAARSGIAIEENPLLQERNFGDLRGTPYDQLTEDPFAPGFLPPGGESVEVFHRRVAQAFALLVERRRARSGSLVVVTHGLVCGAVVKNHARASTVPDHFANAGLTVLDPDPPFEARLINCTQHLVPEAPDVEGTGGGGPA